MDAVHITFISRTYLKSFYLSSRRYQSSKWGDKVRPLDSNMADKKLLLSLLLSVGACAAVAPRPNSRVLRANTQVMKTVCFKLNLHL